MVAITRDQRSMLGGRSFGQTVKDMSDFAEATRLLMSQETAAGHPGKWVAVYHGRIFASDDLDKLLSILDDEGIPRGSSAIGLIEQEVG